MNELESIGRYHQLHEALQTALSERNNLLSRAAAILQAASEAPVSRYNLARRCNFEAAERLLGEARAKHDAALLMLEELRQVAPAANKPVPTLE